MYEVVLFSGRKIVSRMRFDNEDKAWEFFEENRDKYACEFKNLSYYKVH